jgi:hypothetical protein
MASFDDGGNDDEYNEYDIRNLLQPYYNDSYNNYNNNNNNNNYDTLNIKGLSLTSNSSNNNEKTIAKITMMNSSPKFHEEDDPKSRKELHKLLKDKFVPLKSMKEGKKDKKLTAKELLNLSEYDITPLSYDDWNSLFEIYYMNNSYHMKLLDPLIEKFNQKISMIITDPMDILWIGAPLPNYHNVRNELAKMYKNRMDKEILVSGSNILFKYDMAEAALHMKNQFNQRLDWFPRFEIFYPIVQNLSINGHMFEDLAHFVPFTQLKRFTFTNGWLTNLKHLCRFRKLEYLNVENNNIANVDSELNFIGPGLKHIKMINGNPIKQDNVKLLELKNILSNSRLFHGLQMYKQNLTGFPDLFWEFEKFDDYNIETILVYGSQGGNEPITGNILTEEVTRFATEQMNKNKTNEFIMNTYRVQNGAYYTNWMPSNIILCNITTVIILSYHTFQNIKPFLCFINLKKFALYVGPLSNLDGIEKLENLTHLVLPGNKIEEITSNIQLQKLTKLQHFLLTGNPITKDGDKTADEKMKWVTTIMTTTMNMKYIKARAEFKVKTEEEKKIDLEEKEDKKRKSMSEPTTLLGEK